MASAWASNLASHFDPCFAAYIIKGISHGFRIGFAHSAYASFSSSKRNMHSAYVNSSTVDNYIAAELEKGRLLGPFPSQYSSFHSSSQSFRRHSQMQLPGQHRLIVS